MSLVMAIKGPESLILAADSRMTEGYSLDGPRTRDDSLKLARLTNEAGLMTYGLMETGFLGMAALGEEMSGHRGGHPPFNFLMGRGTEAFRAADARWTSKNPDIPRKENDVGFILAGFDRERGEFRTVRFESPAFSPMEVAGGCLLAGEWHIAQFMARRLYRADMTVGEHKQLALLLLDATMQAAKTVGGFARVASITAAEGFRWISEEESAAARTRNEAVMELFRARLRSSLAAAANRIGQDRR